MASKHRSRSAATADCRLAEQPQPVQSTVLKAAESWRGLLASTTDDTLLEGCRRHP
jgi:hypothetical protein